MPTLTWTGKDKVINHHQEVPFRVLEHRYGFNASAGQTNQETGSGNKIIHGDNLLALKTLLPEYEGRIKCIYIDPPYNTGNEGWVYNDNVNDPKIKKWLGEVVGKEGEDLNRHDKWLCMMYPRLKLLYKLLAENGAIFISIDDTEVANLRLVLEEIFGTTNFIANIIWQKKYSPQNDAQFFSTMHDHILVFAKNSKLWQRNLIARTEKQDKAYKNLDNDPRGPWKPSDLTRPEYRERDFYGILTPAGKIVYPAKGRSWSRPKEEIERLRADNCLWFGRNGDSIPSLKRFISEVKQGVVPSSIWFREEVGDNQEAKQEVKAINDENIFDTPKPSKLIGRILQLATNEDSFILDSFAGSGTTAHAVLNLNKQDGGNRKFILVEMEDYAETITAERVRRVMKGYNSTEGTGGEFDYYELGRPLFRAEGELNEDIPVEKIRNYVFYTETKRPLIKETDSNNPYFLEKWKDTGYYFYYEKDRITTLDPDFLATIDVIAEQHLIYADKCLLDKDFLANKQIIFKKIPRDITRF
jgi:adenine-specific DNA-methyltransferase